MGKNRFKSVKGGFEQKLAVRELAKMPLDSAMDKNIWHELRETFALEGKLAWIRGC